MAPVPHLWFLALAAVVIHFHDLQTMAQQSDIVVHAVATDTAVERDGRGRIVTWTELSVVESRQPDTGSVDAMPAPTPETLWLVQLGGQLGDEILSVPGASHVEVGDEFVLFAVKMPRWPGVIIPHTHGAGLFRVATSLAEDVGEVVTAQGHSPAPRVVDDLDTLWRQTGLLRR